MNGYNSIGNYISDLDCNNNCLIGISVSADDIHNYWSKCGLIANFGSSFFSLNYPNSKNISNSISFVINELLENAVKYSYSNYNMIKILVAVENGNIIVDVKNIIDQKQFDILYPVINSLQDTDTSNKNYMKRIELGPANKSESGLGLLSIINFFNGRISGKFLENKEGQNFEANIQVKIDIKDL